MNAFGAIANNFGNHGLRDKRMGKLFDERHLPFRAIHIVFILLFAEIVSQVYEDKVECEGVPASLLITWNSNQQNSGSKTTELPKATDICMSGRHPFSNELHPPRQRHAHNMASLGLSISACLTGSVTTLRSESITRFPLQPCRRLVCFHYSLYKAHIANQ